jgi:hypothetical protein
MKSLRCTVFEFPDFVIDKNFKSKNIYIKTISEISEKADKIKRGDCVVGFSEELNEKVCLLCTGDTLIQVLPGKGLLGTGLFSITDFPPKYWSEVPYKFLKDNRNIVARMDPFADEIISNLIDMRGKEYRILVGFFHYEDKMYTYMHKFTSKDTRNNSYVNNKLETRLRSRQPELFSYVLKEEIPALLLRHLEKIEFNPEYALMALN